jgi:hypothetical protein
MAVNGRRARLGAADMKESRVNRDDRGQVLVIVALGMVAIIAMVGLIIDGGFAWAHQRNTQNGADAVAKAGTVVIQHYLAGDDPEPTDWKVACAVEATATANRVHVEAAVYTDEVGQPLSPSVTVGACGGTDPGTAIPADAQGVNARTSETFQTFLMPVIGFDDLTATASATAVVGVPEVLPGGALPVTFPHTSMTCDSLDTEFTIMEDDEDGTWELFEIIDEADADSSNLAIVPLCDTGPGSVGWLDYECGQNLQQSVEDPCEKFIPIPAWISTQTGDVNSLEDELNAYAGSFVGTAEPEDAVLSVPVHDFTCNPDEALENSQPVTDCPSYPDWSANGNNLDYHIPFWVGFKLEAAYVQGADPECQEAPGMPQLESPEPPGKVGCLKGWFVSLIIEPGPINLSDINRGDDVPLAVALIK